MHLRRHADAASFLATAEGFLLEREAEHNLILGVTGTIRRRDEPRADVWLATVHDAHVIGAAMHTPPYGVVVSECDDPRIVDLLVDALLEDGRRLPTVFGPERLAIPFAAAWRAVTGSRLAPGPHERIHRLTTLVEPRPAPGRSRRATADDLPLIVAWSEAFEREAHPDEPTLTSERSARAWLDDPHATLYLWEFGGVAVSMAGARDPTGSGIRIGPVYTPPAERGRGYASNVTAAASADQLAHGHARCFLYTDLANATANRIYAGLGYEPVTDVIQIRFDPGP